MAIEFDLPLTVKAMHPGAYAMLADSTIHHFDDYAEVYINVYDSEAARWQDIDDSQAYRYTPIKRLRIEIPKAIYDERVKEAAQALAAAIYGVLLEYPEPFGLPEAFKAGNQV